MSSNRPSARIAWPSLSLSLIHIFLGDALEGLEHQIELADIRKVGGAAVRAFDVVVTNIGAHLVEGHAVRISAGILDQLVGTVTRLAVLAVHERIGEAAHMAGSHPHLRVHQNRGVEAHIDVYKRQVSATMPGESL